MLLKQPHEEVTCTSKYIKDEWQQQMKLLLNGDLYH